MKTTYLKKSIRFLATATLLLSACAVAHAQKVAVKTNLVADALASPNLGLEIGVAPKWTVDLTGEFNAWRMGGDKRWKHWFFQPEARYWFCDRFSGHFIGAALHGGQYNIGGFNGRWNLLGTDARKLKDTRFQGWFVGGGVSYGYAWILGTHWNIEAQIGVGYSYTRYDQFRCTGCGKKIRTDVPHNYWGPTSADINIVYIF